MLVPGDSYCAGRWSPVSPGPTGNCTARRPPSSSSSSSFLSKLYPSVTYCPATTLIHYRDEYGQTPENGIKLTLQNVKRSDEKIIVLFPHCYCCRAPGIYFLPFRQDSRIRTRSILSHNNNIIIFEARRRQRSLRLGCCCQRVALFKPISRGRIT